MRSEVGVRGREVRMVEWGCGGVGWVWIMLLYNELMQALNFELF
jgi:hypothetical protein